jgi:hypothetical protein
LVRGEREVKEVKEVQAALAASMRRQESRPHLDGIFDTPSCNPRHTLGFSHLLDPVDRKSPPTRLTRDYSLITVRWPVCARFNPGLRVLLSSEKSP